MKSTLIYLCVLISLFSCGDREVVKSNFPNGNPEWIFYYPNSKDTASYISISYFSNGNKKYETTYKNNALNGPIKEWNKNGQILHVKNYENDILKNYKKWNDNFKIIEEFEIVANDTITIKDNSGLSDSVSVVCQRKNGIEWFENGKIKFIYLVDLDNKMIIKEWNEKGEFIKETIYFEGKPISIKTFPIKN